MKKSLIALGFGTLGLGIAEFVMMAILPFVASDLGVDIPTAGHFISAYALGVFCGTPGLTFVRRFQLKNILLGLTLIMIAGNLFAAFSVNYTMLLIGRFISGLPHGAYFGVASIVAEKLADHGKGSQAVSIMVAGMTIANLFGVPLGTSICTLMEPIPFYAQRCTLAHNLLHYAWKRRSFLLLFLCFALPHRQLRIFYRHHSIFDGTCRLWYGSR